MNRGFYLVIIAQTFSSLADNALFIAAIALIQQLSGPVWMTPVIKWWVAAGFVLLAPFVGAIADSYPKGRVMFATNALKVAGCLLMFCYELFGFSNVGQIALVCGAYAIVGMGAAAYSPAKYGIVTEMLPPRLLVVGNSWMEGMTVCSIIMGSVIGGTLITPGVSGWVLSLPFLKGFIHTPAEGAIVMIGFLYAAASIMNLFIPDTHITYPVQSKNPLKLIRAFKSYMQILWTDKLGQISLAVTTLFWGAGATLQLIVIEWGRQHLGYGLDQSSILMGVAAVGTVIGAVLAAKVPLRASLSVLPVGVMMVLVVLAMPYIYATWAVYTLLLLVGGLSGFFVVPMNALLQHRGYVLLTAGHSIAVQNFNEQLNILLMVTLYTLMLWLEIPINTVVMLFGLFVAGLMFVVMLWSRSNLSKQPDLLDEIGQDGHGQALS